MKILIISPQPWNGIQLSKHHYARTLAKMGHEVFFLNPPKRWNPFFRRPLTYKDNGVTVIETCLPISLRIINSFTSLRELVVSSWINNALRKINNIDIIWCFDNYSGRIRDLKGINGKYRILHMVDNSSQMNKDDMGADLVVGVRPEILEQIDTIKLKVHVPHALSPEFMQNAEIEYSPSMDKIRFGYFGNLSFYPIDYGLMVNTIKELSNCEWHFWGPLNENAFNSSKYQEFVAILKSHERVYWHGVKRPKDLIVDVRSKGVNCFFAFYQPEIIRERGGDSNKLREYLSFGLPILSNRIDQYIGRDLLIFPENGEVWTLSNFKKNVERIQKGKFDGSPLRTYASKLSYEDNCRTILNLL